jgi:hypothetical protein
VDSSVGCHMVSSVELRRSGNFLGLPNPSVENAIVCEMLSRGVKAAGWDETKELGGTRGNFSDTAARLSAFIFRCMMTPHGAAQADSTSKGMWTT